VAALLAMTRADNASGRRRFGFYPLGSAGGRYELAMTNRGNDNLKRAANPARDTNDPQRAPALGKPLFPVNTTV
jgi:hypothetical protein